VPNLRRHAGFTLMEVLVAMLIAALALLGLAASQVRAIQFSYSSLQQTIASIEANNVLERLWPELCALQGGRTATTAGGNPLDINRYQLPAGAQIPDLQLQWPANYRFNLSPYDGPVPPLLLQVRWQDPRQGDAQTDQLSLKASFPWLINGNDAGC